MNIPEVVNSRFIFKSAQNLWWSKTSHIYVPVIVNISDRLKVFYSGWDENKIGRIGVLDLDFDFNIIKVHEDPVLDIGDPGTFCDSGVTPSDIEYKNGSWFLYFIGWQKHLKIRYTLFAGVAKAGTLNDKFTHESKVPFLDRSDSFGLHVRTAPTIVSERIYYSAGDKFIENNGKMIPTYHFRCQLLRGDVPLVYNIPVKKLIGVGKSYIWNESRLKWRGLFSVRYLVGEVQKYKIMYSESKDGLFWDDFVDFMPPSTGEWDSEMQCFPYLVMINGKVYMFYNGNNFGETGFGVVELKRSINETG